MFGLFKLCRWVGAAGAAALAAAQALTLDELAGVFPKHRLVEDAALIFAHEGVHYVALANEQGEVGLVLLLPVSLSDTQRLEELALRFRALLPDGPGAFQLQPFSYKGKNSRALLNMQVLKESQPQRNHWLGVPLFECLAYGLAGADGRLFSVSEDCIVLDVPHASFGRMRVSVYLLGLDEVRIVDVVTKKRSKKCYENAAELSEVFDFYYHYTVDEDELKGLKRDYMISRPLAYGRFYLDSHYTTLPSYVAAEGAAFRIGTARAFRDLRAQKNWVLFAYEGEECPMPASWPVSGEAGLASPKGVPSPGEGAGSAGAGEQGRKKTPVVSQDSASPVSRAVSPAPAAADRRAVGSPDEARKAYLEALRHL